MVRRCDDRDQNPSWIGECEQDIENRPRLGLPPLAWLERCAEDA